MSEQIKLKKCPFCGGKGKVDANYKDGFRTYYVICESCGCYGPVGTTNVSASLLWNCRSE